ncbi:MAG: putative Ig domain-containing protein, partial [Myxococcota bacterium]
QTVMAWIDRAQRQIGPPIPYCPTKSSIWSRTSGGELERLHEFTETWLYGSELTAASVETESVVIETVETSGPTFASVLAPGLGWDLTDDGTRSVNYGYEILGRALSSDGLTAAGSADLRAAFWPNRAADGVQFPRDNYGFPFSVAVSVSDSADRVVGVSFDSWTASGAVEGAPFFWSPETGFLDLEDLLTSLDVGFTGWSLETSEDALKISGDGTTIVGLGTNPSGDPEAWRVVLPPLASIPLPAQAPIVFSPFPVSVGETGAISFAVEASDPNADPLGYAMTTPEWVLQSSSDLAVLPPGFTIDPNTGLISGALTVRSTDSLVTTYYAEITVSDGGAESVIEILFNAWRPRLVDPGTRFAVEGTTASLVPQVEYPAPGLSWSATGLPSGFSIDPTTGVISGTFAEDAALGSPYAITLEMNDGQQTSSASFEWVVLESFSLPALGPEASALLVLLLAVVPLRRLSRAR